MKHRTKLFLVAFAIVAGTLLLMAGAGTGPRYVGRFFGDGTGLSNSVDLVEGPNILITPGPGNRAYTIESTAAGAAGIFTNSIMGYGDQYRTNYVRISPLGVTVNSGALISDRLVVLDGAASNYIAGDTTMVGSMTVDGITASGTIFTSDVFEGNGVSLTNLNGTEIRSGTVADARIASTIARDSEVTTATQNSTNAGNIAFLPANNVFAGSNYFTAPVVVNTNLVSQRLVVLDGAASNYVAGDTTFLGSLFIAGVESSGTIFTSDVFEGNGISITNLNGDEIRSGTVADARIASTIARDSEIIHVAAGSNITIVTNGMLRTISSTGGSATYPISTNGGVVSLVGTNNISSYQVGPDSVAVGYGNNGGAPHNVLYADFSDGWTELRSPDETNAIVRLGNDGNITFTGTMTSVGAATLGTMSATGTVSAASFEGDGSGLTNITAAATNLANFTNMIWVTDFGAATNLADNSAAINLAIQAATNYGKIGDGNLAGGTVYIPRGYWNCTNTITLYPGISLIGAGREATLLYFGASAVDNLIDLQVGEFAGMAVTPQVRVESMKLYNDRSSITNAGATIKLDGGRTLFAFPTVRNVDVFCGAQYGILVTNAIGGLIENCEVRYANSDGIKVTATYFTTRNTFCQLNKGYGFHYLGTGYSSIIGGAADANQSGGYLVSGGATGTGLYSCGAERNWTNSVRVTASYDTVIIAFQSWMATNQPVGAANHGIYVDNTDGLLLEHCHLQAHTTDITNGYAVYFPAANSSGVEVKNVLMSSHGSGVINNTNACAVYTDLSSNYQFNMPVTATSFTGSGAGLTNLPDVSVLAYGAGTAVADNSAAFAAAIQAVTNASGGYGGTVRVPMGTFVLSNTVTLYPGMTLQGASREGTILKFGGSLSNLIAYDGAMQSADAPHYNDIAYVGVKDLQIRGHSATDGFTGNAISLANETAFISPEVKNVFVIANAKHGIFLEGCIGGSLDGVQVRYSDAAGIVTDSVATWRPNTAMNFRNCYVTSDAGFTGKGWALTNLFYSQLSGCAADGNAIGYYLKDCRNVGIKACGAEANRGDNLWIKGGYDNTLDQFYTVQGGYTTNAITLDGTIGLDIKSCNFNALYGATNQGYGIWLTAAASFYLKLDTSSVPTHGLGGVSEPARFDTYAVTDENVFRTENVITSGTMNATNGFAVGALAGIDKTFTLYTADAAGTGRVTNSIIITKGIITQWNQ